ncbi:MULTISPECIES: ABC transporter substrate-binding protein [Aerococcus]|uniref:ABC transporter substrate-binding protein n=1 Tax=Aerococcus sanguinicola TaxID=119206 RepID=A0A5N1GPK4_9LACT|nr:MULTISPECIES: ABC transporter substrate-binding protein [Aerococcus]KAA9302246.1 ABC transporter substrate-binding protein [Aerococcus sanguinicola]MDK6368998.1 ABC transporter substrate-binding protein [Aerococcus sp. UMB9870]MDK6678900.1 ABC transporter substrate-binding protein [Aerococcus sp. UMB8608]MDK6686781.1 ABC transporter substrate-binding protein [Aerococcus sp. UMB8623]MDK6939559.1 ABC transporter substrate-binding protein [Aerococcus sp. UMB8487]
MSIKKFMLLMMSALTLGACSARATQPASGEQEEYDTIKIGGNLELSGGVSAYGIVQNNAIKLAIDEKNAQGGVNGKQIEYEEYDNKSAPEEVTTGAARLVDLEDVAVLLGPATTGSVEAQIPIALQSQTPMITPTATGDTITLDNQGKTLPEVFRTCFQDSFQGAALGAFANQKGFKKAAIIKDNGSDYGQNLADEFKNTYQGEIVADESYVTKETDFSAILTNVKRQDADVIFVAGYYEEAGPLIKQAREMGIQAAILGPDGFGNEEIVNLAGKKNFTDIYYAAHFVADENSPQRTKDFMKNYKARYGTDPDMFAALAYDAAYLAFDAMERAGSEKREAVRQALEATKDFEGITGTFSIDDKHNTVKTAFILEAKEGKVVDSTAIDPE